MPTATSTPARTQNRVSVEAMAMPKCTSTKCATMAAKSTRISSWRRPLVSVRLQALLASPISSPAAQQQIGGHVDDHAGNESHGQADARQAQAAVEEQRDDRRPALRLPTSDAPNRLRRLRPRISPSQRRE